MAITKVITPELIDLPNNQLVTGVSTTYNITVIISGGNKYAVNGTQQANITLIPGTTYTINQDDSTNNAHPLILSTSTVAAGVYSTGVTYSLNGTGVSYASYISGFATATQRRLTITLSSPPTLNYVCYYHQNMGASIITTPGLANTDGVVLPKGVTTSTTDTTGTCDYPTTALALYQLNDNAVDTCNSNQYPGTWTGTESYVTGNFGKAATFSNGSGVTSNYISLPGFMPTGSSSRSISMWIKTTSTAYQEIFSYGSGGNNNYFIFRLPAGGTQLGIAFYANDHDFTATNITDGNWHHCAATYDGNLAKVYYDGVLIGTGTAGSVSTNASNEKISGYQYTGSIDQVRLFPSALSAAQALNLATETNVTNSTGRPTGLGASDDGTFRYNTTTKKVEYYDGAAWFTLDTTVANPQ